MDLGRLSDNRSQATKKWATKNVISLQESEANVFYKAQEARSIGISKGHKEHRN